MYETIKPLSDYLDTVEDSRYPGEEKIDFSAHFWNLHLSEGIDEASNLYEVVWTRGLNEIGPLSVPEVYKSFGTMLMENPGFTSETTTCTFNRPGRQMARKLYLYQTKT